MWSKRIAVFGLVLCGSIVIGLIVMLTTGQDTAVTILVRACIVIPFVALWCIAEIRKSR